MKQVLNVLLNIIKVVLLLVAMGLMFYGLLITYKRLSKPVTEAIPILLPFVLLLIAFVINFMTKQKIVNRNLFYNTTAVLVLAAVTFVCYRAKFDSNMMLYHKYGINYNPSYLSDNIGTIKLLVYLLFTSNVFLMISAKLSQPKKEIIKEVKEDLIVEHKDLEIKEEPVLENRDLEIKEETVNA